MIEQQATVVAIDGARISLQTRRKSACGDCKSQSGCGTSVLGKWVGAKVDQFWLESAVKLNVGDRVVIGVAEATLLEISLITYLTPLLTMLFTALAAASLGAGDLIQALSGSVGFALGLMILRCWVNRHNGQRFQLQLVQPVTAIAPQVGMIDSPEENGYE